MSLPEKHDINRQMYIDVISDMYKELHGVRPRHVDWSTRSDQDVKDMYTDLLNQMDPDPVDDYYLDDSDYSDRLTGDDEEPHGWDSPYDQQVADRNAELRNAERELGYDEPEDKLPKQMGLGRAGKARQEGVMRVTESALKKLIHEAVAKRLRVLKEESGEEGTLVPSAKNVAAFSKKFDDLMTEMIEKTKALADEGEGLIDTNLMNHPEVGTRNELVIGKVGMLRGIANSLATTFERVRRYLG